MDNSKDSVIRATWPLFLPEDAAVCSMSSAEQPVKEVVYCQDYSRASSFSTLQVTYNRGIRSDEAFGSRVQRQWFQFTVNLCQPEQVFVSVVSVVELDAAGC